MKLEGKTALVTGAGKGIGREIALALGEAGAKVIVNYSKSEGPANEVVKLIQDKGGKAVAIKADVSKPEEVATLKAEALKAFGQVDILVNNSGITRDKTFKKMDVDSWNEVLQVNLGGTFHCTRAFIDEMAERGWGRIVNISSIVGLQGNFGQSNYSASKAGMIGLTKTLAREYARKGVTVNAVAPGFIGTERVMAIAAEVLKDKILPLIPVGRLGKPEEVAQACVYLCAHGDFITGHVLSINGGQLM